MITVVPKFLLNFPWMLIFLLTSVSATIMPRLSVSRRPIWKTGDTGTNSSLAAKDLQTFYYTQTLDHFNYRPESYTTFQQRYLLNSKHWGGPNANSSSPIFVYLGPEQPIDNDVAVIGFLNDYAPQVKALIVFIEHRYYGQSTPFGSLQNAFSNANTLGYFTSAQALADYAEVIVSLKKNLSATASPVIVIGGSYGGMLASWFRLKYPHIALGALASSAPVLYFDDLTPHDKYYVIATNVFKEASKNCYKTIRQSWSKIDEITSKANGLSILSEKFKTCKPIKDPSTLKNYLEGIYTSAAQYDQPPYYPVNRICDAIDQASKNSTDILTRLLAGVDAIKGSQSCHDLEGRNTTYTDLGWYWQTCTDLVIPLGRDRANTMFPVSPYSLEASTQYCRYIFGASVTPRPHWIVTEFGGHDIKLVLKKFGSNIIYSNGLRDPYSSGGILQNISKSILAIYTTKGSHALDIVLASKDDPEWLVDMRNSEIKIIKGWIAEYYAMRRS